MTANDHTGSGGGQTGNAGRVLQRLRDAWLEAGLEMRRMSGMARLLPEQPFEVFRLIGTDEEKEIKVDIQPVVFNLPERRKSGKADLYVVVRGWLTFEGPDYKRKPLLTKEFGTEIGYFRSKGRSLEHVYGAHYDMDEIRAGHPVFHAQMTAFPEFAKVAIDRFNLGDGVKIENHVGSILGTVRTPSSQMDVFSVITQLCADHLLGKGAGDLEQEAFIKLRKSCDFLTGVAHRLAFLNERTAANCYRATHWYQSPTAMTY